MCYFAYFMNYLHLANVFMLITEGTKAIVNLYFFLDVRFLLVLIDLPFFIMALKKDIKSKYTIRITGFLATFFLSIICFCLLIPCLKNATSPLCHVPSESNIVKNYGTLVNDIFSFYLNHGSENIIKNLKYGKKVEKNASKKHKPNVIVLQLESIDASVVNATYKGKYIAPYLHSLSEEYVYYPYTMSYHLGGGTSDSEFSILNSIEPLQSYPAMKLPTYDYPNSFIKQLNNNDYTCLAFHGNVASYFNRDNAFSAMGFSKFYDISGMHLSNKGWGASDGDVFDFAKKELLEISKPFFSYIITMTSHASFTNASHYYNNADYNDISDVVVHNYFNSVSYVDMEIENFVTYIKENIPDTYVFIWGDHTPQINKPLYSQAALSFDSRYFEFVPLIILTPNDMTYKEDSKVACFLDIAPTILNACGVKYSIYSDGDDLLDFNRDNSSLIPFKDGLFSREKLFEKLTNK